MESRLPKRKIAVSNIDRANRIAANHIKFVEAFPRVPLATVNPENPPLYQSIRTRATSPDPRDQRKMDIDRHLLRRSRSISDLTHLKVVPLKRGAAGTLDSIPAKMARVNIFAKPTSSTSVVKPVTSGIASKPPIAGIASKSTTNGIGMKPTTSGTSNSFKRPVTTKPATAGPSAIVKSNVDVDVDTHW